MTSESRGHFASLPVDRAQRVNAACDRFEAAWGAGAGPGIEAYLAEAPAADRAALFRELLGIELELRRAAGDRPSPEEYRGRFPAHAGAVVAAFGATAGPPPGRVLETIAASAGPLTRVLLPETLDGDGQPLRPHSPEMPPAADRVDRFHLLGEMARGGMGAVLRGRDPDLGRDLAIKVLLEAHRDDPGLVRRFVEEAQIGGQLQHPGIVPVYELGAFSDRRPYFAMKLVRGRTLAALLQERQGTADLPRFLSVFEAVCQTVAYAHARGVIHRDLKPSNVMVGDFGEVQVMDWGLAKVLAEGGAADDERAGRANVAAPASVIHTVRSGSAADASQAGSVLGTPAYMPPEQAGGDIDAVDRRADVFCLGAILCEVLTGEPPYAGRTPAEILRRAARGDLADAFARLDAAVAAPELVELARGCLAADPDGRPRDAGVVAGRVKSYLAGVQERLRAAEIARAEAQARAAEERKRRRLAVALAASVVLTVAIGGGGWAHLARQRAARRGATAGVVNRALDRAVLLRGQAQAVGDGDLPRWAEATAAADGAAVALAAGDPDPALRARVENLRVALARELAEAKARAEMAVRDRELLARLDEVRSGREPFSGESGAAGATALSASDAAYAAAFRQADLDPDLLGPGELGGRLAARPAGVIAAVIAALDDWASVRLQLTPPDSASAGRLLAAARAADPDPWRNGLRDAIEHRDPESYRRLAADPGLAAQTPSSLWLLGRGLGELGQPGPAVAVLRAAQQRHPGDYWLNYELGRALFIYKGPESGPEETRMLDAVRFLTAALALRPRSPAATSELGYVLAQTPGKGDEAVAMCREGVRLRPDFPNAHTHLAVLLRSRGRLDESVASWREAIRLKPGWGNAHLMLGQTLADQGRLDDAVAEYRAALRLATVAESPAEVVDLRWTYDSLGDALARQGKVDEAAAAYRAAVAAPNYPGVSTQWKDIQSRSALTRFLLRLGKRDEAATEARELVRRTMSWPQSHALLGSVLWVRGEYREALASYREALRLDPLNHATRGSIARCLLQLEKFDEAVAEARVVTLLKPDDLAAHWDLARALLCQGKPDEAVTSLRRARDFMPANSPQAAELAYAERLAVLAPRLDAVLRGEDRPADPAERVAFAELAYNTGRYAGSTSLYKDALTADRGLAGNRTKQHTYNAACAAALAGTGRGRDAPEPDGTTQVALRQQALGWLRAELVAWSKAADGAGRDQAVTALEHWKVDPDLAGVRDASALEKLPEDERQAWQALWAEVDSLLGYAGATRAKPAVSRPRDLPSDPFAR